MAARRTLIGPPTNFVALRRTQTGPPSLTRIPFHESPGLFGDPVRLSVAKLAYFKGEEVYADSQGSHRLGARVSLTKVHIQYVISRA